MTTMPTEGPEVGRLLGRIRSAGFPLPFLRRQLPDWWSAEAEAEPGAVTDLKILLSRRLGLDLASVLDEGPVALSLPSTVKFKRNVSLDEEPPDQYVAYCTAVANAVAAAVPRRSNALADAASERAAILADERVRWVSLNALLRRCWEDLGVAVVQVVEEPPTAKGFDAASFRIDGLSVIVLAKRAAYSAWSAFWLAHELGHLAAGHVVDGGAIVDESDATDPNDIEEAAADGYGLELLGGETAEVQVVGDVNSPSLAATALAMGRNLRIDPGHLILRYARATNNWELAQAALARLEADADVAATVNTVAARFIDFSLLGEDVRAGLYSALGLPG